MNIIAVVNQKGGVAKTTTTANLGASLAARGMRTLLIDLDPQANLTLGLRREWNDLPYGLADSLYDPETNPIAAVIRPLGNGLFLTPGHIDLAECEALLVRRGNPVYNLRKALTALGEIRYEWCLIDCPPSLGMLTQNALLASRYLVVPTEPKVYAFAGMDTLNKMIASLAGKHHFEIELLGVLMTMYERRTRLHATIAQVIRDRFGEKVFETIIYRNIKISEAEIEGKPILSFDRRSPGARSYAALAEEIIQRVKENDERMSVENREAEPSAAP